MDRVGPDITSAKTSAFSSVWLLAPPTQPPLGRRLLGNRRRRDFNRLMPAPGVADPLDWEEASQAVANVFFQNELHPHSADYRGKCGESSSGTLRAGRLIH